MHHRFLTLRWQFFLAWLAIAFVSGSDRFVHADVPASTSAVGIDFRNDIEPLLSRYGCNAGGCHGKASGQNGFKLSLFGFDATYDYDEIVKRARGRRIS